MTQSDLFLHGQLSQTRSKDGRDQAWIQQQNSEREADIARDLAFD